MANTPNFNLYKPARTDTTVDVDTSLSDNFDKIDTELKTRKDDLDTHKADVNAHASDKITHADGSVKSTLDNHEERIVVAEMDIFNLDARVDDLETNGTGGGEIPPDLENRLTTVESDVEGILAPATFDAMNQQSYTFDEYRIGYVNNKLGDVSLIQLPSVTNAVEGINELVSQLAQSAKKTDYTVTPESFGAIGDGVADDTTEIQAMFDSLTTKSNRVIFNPFKTYKISAKINIPDKSNIVVVGYGAKLKLTGDFTGLDFGSSGLSTNKNNIHVFGLEVEGAETSVGSRNFSTGALIQFTKVTNISVRDCILHNGNCNGISAIDCLEVSFMNNKVYEVNLHPIWTNRCENVLVEWNRLTGIGNVGGTMPIGTSSEVTRGGIGYLGTKGNNIVIRNNRIKNTSDTGSKTEGANNVIYEGNYVTDCGKDGIKIQDYQDYSTDYTTADPQYHVVNGKIINNTVEYLHEWRSDGSSCILGFNCWGLEIRGNIVRGGQKATSVVDLNGITKAQSENAVRAAWCVDVVVDGHIEQTSTTTDSYYMDNNTNIKMVNCQFKKHGKWNFSKGNDFVSNNDIGNNPSNLNDNAFLAIHPTNIVLNNNRIGGVVQVQPSTNTKSIKIKNNEIIQNGTNDTLNVTNFTTSNASVENLEIVDNTLKIIGTSTTNRAIRVGCDKTSYKIVKIADNIIDRNGQSSIVTASILADASGNGFKITDLLTGANFPSYVHSAGNSANVVTNTTV